MDRWAVEPKFDGWRARVLIDGESMVVRSPPGRSITPSVPGLAPLRALGARVLLDDELIIGGDRMAD